MNKIIIAAVGSLIIGAVGGVFLAPKMTAATAMSATTEAGACPDGGQPQYWVAPMDANFRRDAPGKSPMGMDLVPYCEASSSAAAVTISPAVEQNLGVRTTRVSREMLGQTIRAVGTVGWNEETLLHIHSRAEGWIEQVGVATAGDTVTAGDLVYSLYSPKLYAAEADYLAAGGNRLLREAAANRLRSLGYTSDQVREIKKRAQPTERMTTNAPADLTVVELGVRAGEYVTPGSMIMVLADPTQVWLTVQVAERDAARIHEGMQAQAMVAAWPDRRWDGVVDHVYPELDPMTRTLRVRLAFANPDQALKPNMYAAAIIETAKSEPTLVIPASAVIRGGYGARVVKALGDGQFDVVAVRVGHTQENKTQVLDGLAAGDRVVSSGQFLIDSEANVDAEALRLSVNEIPAGMATAKVIDVNNERRDILLQHGDFTPMGSRGLSMPGMTMGFSVADGVELGGLRPGEQVHVVVENPAPGVYTVRELHRMDGVPDTPAMDGVRHKPGHRPLHEDMGMSPDASMAPSAMSQMEPRDKPSMDGHQHD